LANIFDGFYISHVSCLQNTKGDALPALVAMLASSISNTSQRIIVATHQLLCPRYSLQVKEVHVTSTDFELRDWQFSIIDYSLRGILLDDLKEAISIR